MQLAQAQFQMPPQQVPQAVSQYPQLSGHPMMFWLAGNQGALWFYSVLWFVTWILVIAILVALLRWLWKKGDKNK